MMKISLLMIGIFFSGFVLWGQQAEVFNLADSLSRLNRFYESNAILGQFIGDNPKRKYDVAKALFMISNNYLQMGEYGLALEKNTQSNNIRDQLHSDDVVENCTQFGTIFLVQGDNEKALFYLYQARELPFEDPQLYALINSHIASAYTGLGNYELALEFYRRAIEILQIELGEDHPAIATAHFHIGRLYLLEGKMEQAGKNFEKALRLAQNQWIQTREVLQATIVRLADGCLRAMKTGNTLAFISFSFELYEKLITSAYIEQ